VYILDGKRLALDRAFSHGGISYPANWLRLSSPAERQAIGITEAAPEPTWNKKFYWGYDTEGNLIHKDHAQLVSNYSAQTKQTANSLLSGTDWMVIRAADNGTAIPSGVKSYREEVRTTCSSKITALAGTADTPALAEYIQYVSPSGGASTDYNYWPEQSSEA
jgi:hypothetical protein